MLITERARETASAKTLAILGVVLVAGGLAHSAGIAHLYATAGLPDANRVLLDLWIAESQLLGGALYVSAARHARRGLAWRAQATIGALAIIGYAVPILPVLFSRAPMIFRVPPMVYLVASVLVLFHVARSR